MKIILVLLLSVSFNILNAQRKTMNLIISIDNEVLYASPRNTSIVIVKNGGSRDTVKGDYNPGILSIDSIDYIRLIEGKNDSIMFVTFLYSTYKCEKDYRKFYEIQISKRWFENYFNI